MRVSKYYRKDRVVKLRGTYPVNWRALAQAIKKRDRYICKRCGAKKRDRELDVHHKLPLSKGGSNRKSNLVTLCQKCHKKQPGHRHLHIRTYS